MKEISLGRMAHSLREEYTSVSLKRSTNIDNCAPEGYFNIIHAIALTAFDGNPVPIASIREKYNSGVKNSKEIMENCGKLTYQPFPIVESTKRRSINSDDFTSSPLYDEATGITVEERYSNLALSELGRLLTRHYRDVPLSVIENYNSIVPFSLLRKSVPWSMGHKGEMYPLNPSELFKIIDKMLEINHPIVPSEFINKTFRGVDVGENYVVYTNTKSLLTLYARGESSITICPEIEIKRNENKIIIKRPPIDSTTKKLITYLRRKSMAGETNKYTYFDFSPKVDMVGNEAHINVINFRGNNKQILEDFLLDPVIAVKKYIKNETITFTGNPGEKILTEEDKILGKPVETIKLSELKVNKDNMDLKSFTELIEKSDLFKLKAKESEKDKNISEEEEYRAIRSPYNFELDLLPVYETLWNCILGERELVRLKYIKTLENLKAQLADELLMEKATRKEVAQLIYKLQPDKDRERKLLEQTKKGSDILEEGFSEWEVSEIYKSRGNNILPNIFHRDRFENLYKKTQKKIADVQNKIDNPEILNEEIRKDLIPFINGKAYQRKSKVKFIPDNMDELDIQENKYPTKERIQINNRHDNLDIPCTLYFDRNKIRRNYGVNMYFGDFNPLFELNTTNYSKIQIFHSDLATGEVKCITCMAKDIPLDKTIVFGNNVYEPNKLLGVLPVEKGSKFIAWTSKGRFYSYEWCIPDENNLEPDEFIIGWEYADRQFLDIRGTNGIQTVETESFPHFKKGFMPLYENMGIVYDMLNKSKSDKVIRLRNTITFRDYKKQRRVMWKGKYAKPIDLTNEYDYFFSPHRTLYYGGIYIHKRQIFGLSKYEKYLPPKKVILKEFAWVDDGSKDSDKLATNIWRKMNGMVPRMDDAERADDYTRLELVARFTNSYLDFDLDKFSKFDVIDERALKLYNDKIKSYKANNLSRKEYENKLEEDDFTWSNDDSDDSEVDDNLDEEVEVIDESKLD